MQHANVLRLEDDTTKRGVKRNYAEVINDEDNDDGNGKDDEEGNGKDADGYGKKKKITVQF